MYAHLRTMYSSLHHCPKGPWKRKLNLGVGGWRRDKESKLCLFLFLFFRKDLDGSHEYNKCMKHGSMNIIRLFLIMIGIFIQTHLRMCWHNYEIGSSSTTEREFMMQSYIHGHGGSSLKKKTKNCNWIYANAIQKGLEQGPYSY